MAHIWGNMVYLSPIEMDDTENIVRWRNEPSVISNFVYRKPLTREDHETWMKTRVTTGEVVQYIIQIKDSEKKIGSVYFRDIDRVNKSAEFGIFIGEEEERGKGYGAEAAALFAEYGFTRMNLHRIFLRVFEYNHRAIACYERIGFHREGVFRDMVYIDGRFHNMVFMSRLNPSQTLFA